MGQNRKLFIPIGLVAVLLVGGLIAVFLIDNGGSDNDNTTVLATAQSNLAGPASGATLAIQLVDFAIQPSEDNIHAGDTVTFTNGSNTQHDITVDGQPIANHPLDGGQQAKWTFAHPGTYHLVCRIHPNQMTATVNAT